MTVEGARGVCQSAADRELIVVRIEAGYLEGQSFEARLDGIWDGQDPPVDVESVTENNQDALAYIEKMSTEYNGFVITVAPIIGYMHQL